MSDKELNELRTALINGQNERLEGVFLAFRDYCLGMLISRHACSKDEAEDIYVDAIMAFRSQLISKEIVNINIQAYIGKIAQNISLQRKRKKKKWVKVNLDIEAVEAYLNAKENEGKEIDLIGQETALALEESQKAKIDAVVWAKNKLDARCRDLIEATVVDGIKAKELLDRFGFKNVNVFKTTKNRCKKKFQQLINDYINNATNK